MTDSVKTSFEQRAVAETFQNYPPKIGAALMNLRRIITETAKELNIDPLEETLKWGQPSYLNKNGSTLRIDHLKSQKDSYAMFFHCQTKLIDTFKEIYPDDFKYDGNRAILFRLGESFSEDKLKHCVELSLHYHKLKHLPLLGV